MSDFGIQVTDEGFNQALNAIEGIEQLERSELLDALGSLFVESTQERIRDTKIGPDGQAWKKSSGPGTTLYNEGSLHDSIAHVTSSDAVEIGVTGDHPEAAILHFGGVIKPKKADRLVFQIGNQTIFAKKVTMPARPYIGASEEDKRKALEMAARTIAEIWEGGNG